MTQEKGYEKQDRIDVEHITQDRNMLDFCDYYDNGKPFITLAGFMKIANEEGFTTEIHDIQIGQYDVHAIIKVTDTDGNSMFSGRTEYHTFKDGARDKHAVAKAINLATKNAVKQRLYGHPKVKEMLEDFVETTPFVPREKPPVTQSNQKPTETKSNGNGQPKTQTPPPPKTEPPKTEQKAEQKSNGKSKTPKEMAQSWYDSRFSELIGIQSKEYNGKAPKEVFSDWMLYFLEKTPETMADKDFVRVVNELKKQDMGLIGSFFKKKPTDFDERMKKLRPEPEAEAAPEAEQQGEAEPKQVEF